MEGVGKLRIKNMYYFLIKLDHLDKNFHVKNLRKDSYWTSTRPLKQNHSLRKATSTNYAILISNPSLNECMELAILNGAKINQTFLLEDG